MNPIKVVDAFVGTELDNGILIDVVVVTVRGNDNIPPLSEAIRAAEGKAQELIGKGQKAHLPISSSEIQPVVVTERYVRVTWMLTGASEPEPATALSPDCRDGHNHHKCDQQAWDDVNDELTDCGCDCHREES